MHWQATLFLTDIPDGEKQRCQVKGSDIGTSARKTASIPFWGPNIMGGPSLARNLTRFLLPRLTALYRPIINKKRISLVAQTNKHHLFIGVIQEQDKRYDFTLCNPPFHASSRMASSGRQQTEMEEPGQTVKENRRWLGETQLRRANNELWCDGGKSPSLKMVQESVLLKTRSAGLRPLSKAGNLDQIKHLLKKKAWRRFAS